MSTKVKVHGEKGTGRFMYLEVSGGQSGEMGDGTHEFSIGADGAMIQFLTIRRLHKGTIKVLAETGDIQIEVDGGKVKSIKKGKIFSVPSSAKRVVVKERPHR